MTPEMRKWLEGELPEATHPIIPCLEEVAIFDITQKDELLKRFLVPANFSRSFTSIDDQSRKYFINTLHMLALKNAESKREAAKQKIAAAAAAKRTPVRRQHVPLYTEQMHPEDVLAARQKEAEIKARIEREQARRFRTPTVAGAHASSSSAGAAVNLRNATISVSASSNVRIGLNAPSNNKASTAPTAKKKTKK